LHFQKVDITFGAIIPPPEKLSQIFSIPYAYHFLTKLMLRMKKINTYLHNPDVQGAIVISFIVLAIALVTMFTWGK
jgi:hypothetical protein